MFPRHPWRFCYVEDLFQQQCFAFGKTCKFKRQRRLNIGKDAAGYIRSDVVDASPFQRF